MIRLPLTPHIEGVLEKSQDLSIHLERNGVDIDLFFHCFLMDLSLSCSSIFKRVRVDPKEWLKESMHCLNKKRKNKNVKGTVKTEVRKLLAAAEAIAEESFGLDYIPPEIILMTFFSHIIYMFLKIVQIIYRILKRAKTRPVNAFFLVFIPFVFIVLVLVAG